jgi:hypothetical protein
MQNLYIFNVTVYQNGAEGEELSQDRLTTHKSVNHTRLKGVVYDFPCLVATWHRNRYYLALGGRMSYGGVRWRRDDIQHAPSKLKMK